MKNTIKIFTIVFAMIMSVGFTNAQVQELDFVGQTAILNQDSSLTLLDKQLTTTRTAASASFILTGIGKIMTQMQIEGCCSSVSTNTNVQLIIKSIDNQNDPLAVLKIFKFKVKPKVRRAELSSFGLTSKENNLDYVPFKAVKYGMSSYLVSLQNLTPGEYGVILLNPNIINERQVVVSTFNVK
jgi:hypothetical protein